MTTQHRLIDLSHTIEHGMITYQGLPAPVISDYLSREASRGHYAEDTSFQIGRIELVANTGTYLDSPFHRFEGGRDLSELPLESLADLAGVVLRAEGRTAIDREAFAGLEVAGRAVLVHCGWARHWRTEMYWSGQHPFLTEDAAQYLADAGAKLVGIDSYNIDSTADKRRPAHTILLGAEIPIVEHLCSLELLPASDFRFFAVPVKIKGFGTCPVRAFALI